MCRIKPEGRVPHGKIVAVVLFKLQKLYKF